jgi:glucoamylase
MSSSSRSLVVVLSLCVVSALAPAAVAQGPAPGAPGTDEQYLPADKSGLGTSATRASRVWFTVQKEGGLGEVYFPTADAPSARALQFVVGDRGRAVPANDAGRVRTTLVDARSLTYRQTFTAPGRWRLGATYVADPARATVLVRLRVASLDGRRHRVYAIYDPALANTRAGDSGRTQGAALVATDQGAASALVGSPAFRATSSGFRGVSDGWTDLADGRLDWRYASADNGNVVQTAKTSLTGRRGARAATLALGFGTDAVGALTAARASTPRGFANAAAAYARGWHAYLAAVKRPPAVLRSDAERTLYRVSVMTLAASEDKTHPGAYVASPTMPWIWGHEDPSNVYHLVWSRDLYQIATGLIAAGDLAGANRALDFLFGTQQKADGSFPQNSRVDGTPVWTGLQLDEVAFPIVLAYQLGRTGAAAWDHVKRAADFLVGFEQDGNRAPWSPQDRWENQSGYSPATIASEIAGLVCAAVVAERNGDAASAQRYRATADAWQARVKDWTVTTTGPYSPGPYFLRVTKDGNPNAGTTYAIGDSGPSMADQRSVVDPSFLDLVRLGVLPAYDPAVVNSLAVVDRQLGVPTANGLLWHRASFDGYGEKRDGSQWEFGLPDDSFITLGRAWPLLNGERGEYQLAAGDVAAAAGQLRTMASAAGPGAMLPEQVWDTRPPAGTDGFVTGRPTFSATPLAWTHAQYLRLAWDVQARAVLEQPRVVARRYAGVR